MQHPEILNREHWLNVAIKRLQNDFAVAELTIPNNVKVSCGWTSKGAKGKAGFQRIGECWSPVSSSGGFHEIFISPRIDDGVQVLATLVHELIHACVGVEHKHDRFFGKYAKRLNLEGKLTATTPNQKLTERLNALIGEIGDYPHARMETLTNGKKKQTARMLKVECPECGYTVRIADKWIQEGCPTCPCGCLMVAEEPKGD